MDPNNNGTTPPAGGANINNNGTTPPTGTPPNPAGTTPPASNGGNGAAGNDGGVQLTAEQLAAAFNHPRFKELNERAKKADELQAAADKAAEELAKKNGEFEKLYQTAEERATKAEQSLKQSRIENAVSVAAAKLGVVDPAAAIKLLDQSGISVSEDGKISGVDEAVKTLSETSPYLFKLPQGGSIGGGTNPTNTGATEFTMSQVKDIAFYKANQAAVDKAVSEGRIDMSKQLISNLVL